MNKVTPSGKNIALIAYLTFLGLIVAYFLNKDKKHPFAQWHIKNMFGLVLFRFAAITLEDYDLGFYLYWLSVGLWVISFTMALIDHQKAIPYFSEKFQEWFTFLD